MTSTLGFSLFSSGRQYTVKCILLSAVFNDPAKSMSQNMVQFNDYYGCPDHLIKGRSIVTSKKDHKPIYLFNYENPCRHEKLRDHKTLVSITKQVEKSTVETGKIVPQYGLKGCSWPMVFPKFNIVQGVVIDYMHLVLIGVVKMLMKLGFDQSNRKADWFTGRYVQEIDHRVAAVQTPNVISRIPCSIANDLKHWEIFKYCSFLLFYSAIVFWDLLTPSKLDFPSRLGKSVKTSCFILCQCTNFICRIFSNI